MHTGTNDPSGARVGRHRVPDRAERVRLLSTLGVVAKGPGGRWSPGSWSLEELPLPLATLERDWARERRRRVKHAHRYE